MGYTTEFEGHVVVVPPLNDAEISYLVDFATTRRMLRGNGPYYVGSGDMHAEDIVDRNCSPAGQPGLWCQWSPSHNGRAIEWDGGEKFYNSASWMEYLIEHFLTGTARDADEWAKASALDWRLAKFTFDHHVDGVIEASGENPDDHWYLVVEDNKVSLLYDESHDFPLEPTRDLPPEGVEELQDLL